MGFGDELMATGHAQRVYDGDPSKRVAICDRAGRPRWDDLWAGNPIIAHPREISPRSDVHRIRNAPGCRPYIRYPWMPSKPIQFSGWRARDHVGRIYLTDAERARAERLRMLHGSYVVIEPSPKSNNPNKAWLWDRWLDVVKACPDVRFVQMRHRDTKPLPGVYHELTTGFRDACAVLAGSVGYVGTEGGLHHAAAVLGLQAVVIFGGFISPDVSGYPSHLNLADDGPGSPCGIWRPCPHCRAAMARITVERVVEGVRSLHQTTREACA